jgi:hypothetical protein
MEAGCELRHIRDADHRRRLLALEKVLVTELTEIAVSPTRR